MDVFFDIDGTLTVEIEGFSYDIYMARTPRYEIITRVNALYEQGHKITLWTARHLEDREVTEKWLQIHGVKYHELILGKPHFGLYICDRAINVEYFKLFGLS